MTRDLRHARNRGYFVLAIPGLGGVRIGRTHLRFDPAMPVEKRERLVLEALRDAEDGPLVELWDRALRARSA